MMNRKQRLNSALDNAKRHLQSLDNTSTVEDDLEPSKDFTPSRSKLNHLLGRKSVQDSRNSKLLQRVGVSSRPTFDLIADHVLGRDSRKFKPSIDLTSDGDDISDVVAKRLANLRQRTFDSLEDISQSNFSDDNNYVGFDDEGTPIWKSVMQGQRRSDKLTNLELEQSVNSNKA